MVGRFQAKRLERQVFEGLQNIGSALEKNFLIASVEVREDFGVAFRCGTIFRNRAYVYLQFESGDAHYVFKEVPQLVCGGLPVELSVANEFKRHRAFGGSLLLLQPSKKCQGVLGSATQKSSQDSSRKKLRNASSE